MNNGDVPNPLKFSVVLLWQKLTDTAANCVTLKTILKLSIPPFSYR